MAYRPNYPSVFDTADALPASPQDDMSGPSAAGAQSRRELHIAAEQRRRHAINTALDDLRGRVGCTNADSKATVLGRVIQRFQELEDETIDLRARLDMARRELAIYRHRDDLAGPSAPPPAPPMASSDTGIRLPSFDQFASLAASGPSASSYSSYGASLNAPTAYAPSTSPSNFAFAGRSSDLENPFQRPSSSASRRMSFTSPWR